VLIDSFWFVLQLWIWFSNSNLNPYFKQTAGSVKISNYSYEGNNNFSIKNKKITVGWHLPNLREGYNAWKTF